MKKILFSVLMLVSVGAFAQQRGGGYDRNDNGKKYDRDGYYYTARQRDEEVRNINYLYDNRIREAMRMRGRRNDERRDWISRMESERRQKIRDINNRYDDRRNTYCYADYRRK